MYENLGKRTQVNKSIVRYGSQFAFLKELSGDKDCSSCTQKLKGKMTTPKGVPFAKSLLKGENCF